MDKERLQKVIAAAGVASRRQAEQLIVAGRVQVDGETVRTLGVKVDPHAQRVVVDGNPITQPALKTYMLHKPLGVVSTVSDPQGRPTVSDLLASVEERLHPVGRLDMNTSGLLLLTNDGELTYRLTHPSFEVPKRYRVTVKGDVTAADETVLTKGVLLEDGMTAPAVVRIIDRSAGRTILDLTIHEGRNRQVRRMMQAVGKPVVALHRIQFGPLFLGNLPPGRFRLLSDGECQRLKR